MKVAYLKKSTIQTPLRTERLFRLEQARILKKEEIERERKNVDLDSGRFNTAVSEAFQRFGRNFRNAFEENNFLSKRKRRYTVSFSIAGFSEAQQGISIKCQNIDIAWINLGFASNAVIIEAMQTRALAKIELNDFRRTAKQRPLDYLLIKTEETAKKLGFTEIKIRNPQTLHSYQWPMNVRKLSEEQVRRQMRTLYQKIALRHGYKREGHIYFVKKI